MAKRKLAKKKIKDIKCLCGWCSRNTMISNRFDKKKAIWLCEHCQNINEAEIEDKFAIGKIMRNPKEATEAELLLVGGEE